MSELKHRMIFISGCTSLCSFIRLVANEVKICHDFTRLKDVCIESENPTSTVNPWGYFINTLHYPLEKIWRTLCLQLLISCGYFAKYLCQIETCSTQWWSHYFRQSLSPKKINYLVSILAACLMLFFLARESNET
jgi:hypothetical protein